MNTIGAEPSWTPEQIHSALANILEQPQFYGIEPSVAERVLRWWHQMLAILEGLLWDAAETLLFDGRWIITLLAIAAVAWALVFVVRLVRREWVGDSDAHRLDRRHSPRQDVTSLELVHAAQEAHRQGDYKNSIRYFYQACLAHLHAAGVVSLRPHATNWEYLRQARALPDGPYASFGQLTGLFDRIWYGDEPAQEEDCHVGKALARSVIG